MIFAAYITRAITTIAICAMGAYCMKVTNGETGIGWAILGILFTWGGTVTFNKKDDEEEKDDE